MYACVFCILFILICIQYIIFGNNDNLNNFTLAVCCSSDAEKDFVSNVLRCAQAKGTSTPSSDAGNGLVVTEWCRWEKVLLYRVVETRTVLFNYIGVCIYLDKIDAGKLCVASRPGVLLKNLKSNSPRLSDLVGSNFLLSNNRDVPTYSQS